MMNHHLTLRTQHIDSSIETAVYTLTEQHMNQHQVLSHDEQHQIVKHMEFKQSEATPFPRNIADSVQAEYLQYGQTERLINGHWRENLVSVWSKFHQGAR